MGWCTGPLAPTAVLRHPPATNDNQQSGGYQPTDFLPRWLLKITIRDNVLVKREQISYEQARKMEDFHRQGYAALSYWIESANELVRFVTGNAIPKMDGKRKYTLLDRQRMAMVYLNEYFYAQTQRLEGDNLAPNRVEFVWLDEFCLSDEHQPWELQNEQRNVELGRLADIFRGARKVGIFCHRYGCEHTTQECGWSTRLFTLSEILHAKTVEVMIMQESKKPESLGGRVVPYAFVIESLSGDDFRRKMLQSAAEAGKWHLWGLMHSAVNAGSVPWQVAIHSLIVEAVRRDIESEFPNHEFLGKGLNGLLPRRAKPEDLKGENGWSDLTWLLELNQGFYNAASLASICNLGTERSWIGPPIDVAAGSERLKPLTIAFPFGRAAPGNVPPLAIVGAQIIELKPRFKRDPYALYNHDWRITRIVARSSAFAGMIIGGGLIRFSVHTSIALFWISAITFMLVQLIVGAMYLKDEQIFIDTEREGDPVRLLKTLDARWHGKDVLEWGNEQMIPRWDEDKGGRIHGALIDAQFGVVTRAVVTAKPNTLAVLAIHGSGVTSMLMEKPDAHFSQANKVGMCNLPPYCLYLTEQVGSITVNLTFRIFHLPICVSHQMSVLVEFRP